MSADSNTDKGLDKLKELEATIAKELDQKVKLANPTDPRLDGTVQMNPSLNTTRPVDDTPNVISTNIPIQQPSAPSASQGMNQIAKPINSDRKVEDITLEEVDALLGEIDEGFGSQLSKIKQAVGESQVTQNLESISISADYLKDEKDEEAEIKINENDSVALPEDLFESDDTDFTIRKSFWKYLRSITLSTILLPADALWKTGIHFWKSRKNTPKQMFMELPVALKSVITKRQTLFTDFFEHIISYSAVHWIKLFLFIGLIFALKFIITDLQHNTRPVTLKDPFLKTFEEVSDTKKHMSGEGKDNNSIPIPEFVVVLPRIIANLQADNIKRNPMVAVEIYIEASDREAAVEISARKQEVRDLISRILEQMTFAQLDTPEGKDKLKMRIRLGVNKILNNGRTRHIFFKSIQIRE